MNNSSSGLISSVIDLMAERELAKRAKRKRKTYRGVDPDFMIDSADYYIKTHLYILQTVGNSAPGEISAY